MCWTTASKSASASGPSRPNFGSRASAKYSGNSSAGDNSARRINRLRFHAPDLMKIGPEFVSDRREQVETFAGVSVENSFGVDHYLNGDPRVRVPHRAFHALNKLCLDVEERALLSLA